MAETSLLWLALLLMHYVLEHKNHSAASVLWLVLQGQRWPNFCLPRCIWLSSGLCLWLQRRLLCRLCYNVRQFYSHRQQRAGNIPWSCKSVLCSAAYWGLWPGQKGTRPQSWELFVFQIFKLSPRFLPFTPAKNNFLTLWETLVYSTTSSHFSPIFNHGIFLSVLKMGSICPLIPQNRA